MNGHGHGHGPLHGHGPSMIDTVHIKEVWASNLEEEMECIRNIVDTYNYVAMVCTMFVGVDCFLQPLISLTPSVFTLNPTPSSWLIMDAGH
jgi:hypothetical protein